jgi:hypothetical protein
MLLLSISSPTVDCNLFLKHLKSVKIVSGGQLLPVVDDSAEQSGRVEIDDFRRRFRRQAMSE